MKIIPLYPNVLSIPANIQTKKVSKKDFFQVTPAFKNRSLMFKKAKLTDLLDIMSIHNSNVVSEVNKKSFLLSKLPLRSLIKNFFNRDNYYYIVREDSKPIAYLHLSNKIEPDVLLNVKLKNGSEDIQNILTKGDYKYIEVIAVHKDNQKSGVGQFIYNTLFKSLNTNFFAFIAKNPNENIGSTNFHEKMGFVKVGEYSSECFSGFKNYQSGLYFKSKQK